MSKIKAKTFLVIIMLVIIITPKVEFAIESKTNNVQQIMAGDINGDDIIDNKDLLAILRHIYAEINKGEHEDWILTGNKFKIGDITGNGKIDASDRLILLRYMVASRDSEIANKHPEWLELENKKIEIEVETIIQSVDEDVKIESKVMESPADEEKGKENKAEKDAEEVKKSQTIEEKKKDENKTEENSKKSDKVEVTNIKLDKSSAKIKAGETTTLKATIKPNNATEKDKITWKSSNDSIVTVAIPKGGNANNVTLHGYKAGKATITAECAGKSAKCIVTVENAKKETSTEDTSTNISLPEVKYKTHIQKDGWLKFVKNGETSGTTGQSKRMEAIQILKTSTNNTEIKGSIQYRTYVQGIGWTNWVEDGETSGTIGQSKRMETIQIKLTDELEKYCDIYYRAHVQGYGWLGWTKNGESAGSTGISYRMEAIQIKIVEKGDTISSSTASLVTKPLSYTSGVVKQALGAIGVPYIFGGESYKGGMDCSGLVTVCYKRALGVYIPHGTSYLINDKHFKTVNSVDKLSPGDIIVCRGAGKGHVGIWAGNNKVIHEYPRTGCQVVTLKDFLKSTGPSYGKYQYRHYIGN